MCPPDIRFLHLVCYFELLRQTEKKPKIITVKNVVVVNTKQ